MSCTLLSIQASFIFYLPHSISGYVFSRIKAHRHYCGAYFQVRALAHIDHTFISIASLFAAIKFIFLKSVIRVKSIFIKLYEYIIKKISVMFHFIEDEKGQERGGGGGLTPSSLYFYVKLNFSSVVLSNTNLFLSP